MTVDLRRKTRHWWLYVPIKSRRHAHLIINTKCFHYTSAVQFANMWLKNHGFINRDIPA